MLPKHQALSMAWGASKQQTWGELTNLSILLTSKMLKEGKFEDIKQLYTHIAGMRTTIGAILGHSPAVGKIGRSIALTPIENHPDSGYKDLHAEFASWVEHLRQSATKEENITVDKNSAVTLTGTFNHSDEDKPQEYTRSTVFGSEAFNISHSQDQGILLHLANENFKRLDEEDLDNQAKQKCIENIYFYLADAMPCARGAGSIAQMLFYALEDAHTGKMRYLGKMASQFGHAQGVTPDIAAMLSPTVEEFRTYLNNYVIEPDIVVTKKLLELEAEAMEPAEFLKTLEASKQALEKFLKTLKRDSFGDIQRKTVESMLNAFKFLYELAEKTQSDPQQLQKLQFIFTKIKQSLAGNEVCYLQFYTMLDNKVGWPEPQFKDYGLMPNDRDQYLQSIQDATWKVHYLCSTIGELYEWTSDTHHRATHYTAKEVVLITEDFQSKGKRRDYDLRQYLAALEYLINNQKSGFGKGIDEIIDIIVRIDEDKNNFVPKEQTIAKLYRAVCDRFPTELQEDDFQKKQVQECLESFYENSDKIKSDLKSFAPVLDSLQLKNENAVELIQAKKVAPKHQAG